MANSPYVDTEYLFGNFGNIQKTNEFKELLRRGIITKTKVIFDSSHCSFSSGILHQPLNRRYGRQISIRLIDVVAAKESGIRVRPSLVINQNNVNEVFVLDLDKIFSNYRLDIVEVAGITYSVLSGDAIGLLFTLYGVLKNVLKAGSSYISEDVAYMHAYFRLKLNNYKVVTKDFLKKAYDEFFKEIKIDNISTIGAFETIFEKMLNAGLLKKYKNDTFYISRTIGLQQERRKLRGYIVNKTPLKKKKR